MLSDKLTIVIPCKNEESYIHNLLTSLKEQEGIDNIKIYIADSSTDNTREKIDEFKSNLNITVVCCAIKLNCTVNLADSLVRQTCSG